MRFLQIISSISVVLASFADFAGAEQHVLGGNSAARELKNVLGYDFDDAEFVQNYKCNPDHPFQIKFMNREPLLMVLDDLLTEAEADHFIATGLPLLARSRVGNADEQTEWRTSDTAFMAKGNDKVFDCIEKRIGSFVSLSPKNIEPLQLVRYEKGQQYREHHDWFLRDEASQRDLIRGGQRLITLFVYLNTLNDDQGGHTVFPNLNTSVAAKKGRAAFWFNLGIDGKEHPDNLHAGRPVFYGTKFGLNVWIRESAWK